MYCTASYIFYVLCRKLIQHMREGQNVCRTQSNVLSSTALAMLPLCSNDLTCFPIYFGLEYGCHKMESIFLVLHLPLVISETECRTDRS